MQQFVLHTHLYQPERANPWTGVLEPEPSAAPDRDWNARIHRQCYRANAVARVFDDKRRVEAIVNNFERLSFNFGPTLLAWMAEHDPETYAQILAADRQSLQRTGHGNAMAQAFHHTILPLSNDRDRRTQVHWGLADFAHRFGRRAEGMWLPETAVDRATIDALIDAGVAFTVLAPHQAGWIRHRDSPWQDARHTIDPSRPYLHRHSDGSGRSMTLFFYDGNLAQRFAFDPHMMDSRAMTEAIGAASPKAGLVHAAMDGETFGHHHPFGELALAYTLARAAAAAGLEPTNYATYLAAHPPSDEVVVRGEEGTAWSCAHGVGRWARDCGCSTDAQPGWNQAWRAPLRHALDVLRDAAAQRFADVGSDVLHDPWAARDDYVNVLVGAERPDEFLDRHATRHLDRHQTADLWALLESQRNAMAMYTSCGWFFADVSGIETVYVLRFGARVLDLLDEVGAPVARREVLDALGEAKSNRPEVGTAADVWRDTVEPYAVGPARVAAHVALQTAVGQEPEKITAGHTVELTDVRRSALGRVTLATGRVALTFLPTGRPASLAVAAVHLGGLDFQAFVAADPGDVGYERAIDMIWSALPTQPLARLLRTIDEALGGEDLPLEAALPEGQQSLVDEVFSELADRFHVQYARLYYDHRGTLEMLRASGYELPRELRAAAELTLTHELENRLAAVRSEPGALTEPASFAAISELVAQARNEGYQLDVAPVQVILTEIVEDATAAACRSVAPGDVGLVAGWLALAHELDLTLDLARPQEHAYRLARQARSGELGAAAVTTVGRLADLLGIAPVAWQPDAPTA